MTKLSCTTLVFLLFFGTAHSQAPPGPRFALLETGEYHGSDVSLNQPKGWVGVFCREKICVAKETNVRTARVPDPLGEEEEKTPTGTSVEVSSAEKPLFLVRGISPAPRSTGTAFVGENSMVAGDEQKFRFGGKSFVLRVEGKKTPEESLPKGSKLLLSEGTTTQVLFSLPEGGNDPFITVLWIGDIDNDPRRSAHIISASKR